jgi:hypothetical protein
MKKHRIWPGYSLLGLCLLLSLILAACGDNSSTSTPSQAFNPTLASTTQAVNPTTATAPTAATNPASLSPSTTQPLVFPTLPPGATPTFSSNNTFQLATAVPTVTPLPIISSSGAAPLIFYTKNAQLWSAQPDGSAKQLLADNLSDKLYSSALRAGQNQVVFFQDVQSGANTILQLKLLRLTASGKQETTLDNWVNELVNSPYVGTYYQGRSEMAISPDGTQVVYTKVNPAAPAFEAGHGLEHPTELWLANLDLQNPAPKRLVPNDKDFIINPTWSSDGNRIAFLRTNNFGTGAGFPTALWSVYKDGTRLTYLTGPDLGKLGELTYRASPANNLTWVGPMALAYQASNQVTDSIWLHDLSQNSDFSRPLALDAAWNAVYCPAARRFVYSRIGPQSELPGILSVEVDKPGAANTLPPPAVTLDAKGTAVTACQDNNVLYQDAQGQIYLQQLGADGQAVGAKLKLGAPYGDKTYLHAAFSPDGRFIAIYNLDFNKYTTTLNLFRPDGTNIPLTDGNLNFAIGTLSWVDAQTLVIDGGRNESSEWVYFLVTVNLGVSNPTVKQLDSGKSITLITTDSSLY